MANYNRKCRTCGRWINMRQMPHGRWVAFEGDEPHKCTTPSVITPKPIDLPLPMPPSEDFPPIDIPEDSRPELIFKPRPQPRPRLAIPASPAKDVPGTRPRTYETPPQALAPQPATRPSQIPTRPPQPSADIGRSQGSRGWLWWTLAILFMIVFLFLVP